MAYYFFLGQTMLPVPPPSLTTQINGKNKTINLINEGEVNLIKSTGLTEISFSFLLPNKAYPFANYDTSLQSGLINYAIGELSRRLGGVLGNAFSFKNASEFLTVLKNTKAKKSPFRFIVTRTDFDGGLLWNTNMLVTIEGYSINEHANNGTDLMIDIKLKEYRPFGTKELIKTKDKDGNEVLTVKENRFAPDTDYPSALQITNQLSVFEVVKGMNGTGFNWQKVAKISGLTNPLAKNIKGKVVKLG